MIKRLKDNAFIPEDLGNRDYIEYLELLEDESVDTTQLYEVIDTDIKVVE